MLGVRLDPETEAGLARLARQTRRSKSDVARDAMREYLDRHSLDAELQREVRLIARKAADNELLDDLEAFEEDILESDRGHRKDDRAA